MEAIEQGESMEVIGQGVNESGRAGGVNRGDMQER